METILRRVPDLNNKQFPKGAKFIGTGVDFGNGGIKTIALLTLASGELAFYRVKLQGVESLPSKIVFLPQGEVLIGVEAVNAERLGKALSNLIGKDSLDQPNDVYVVLDDRELTAVQVLKVFLEEYKALINSELGIDITEYPIGISYPANFNTAQRERLLNLLNDANLKVVCHQEEPIQALRSMIKHLPKGKNLVVDIGGGTSDISLQECDPEKVELHIKATSACSVAGIDLKDIVAQIIINKDHNGQAPDDPLQMAEISACANQAKHDLTDNESTSIALTVDGFEVCEITRQEFEDAAKPLLDTIEKEIHQVIQDAGAKLSDIAGIILTGGGSITPCVRKRITDKFPVEQFVTETPLHDVALGNAVQLYETLQQKKQLPDKAKYLPPVDVQNVVSHPISIVVKEVWGLKNSCHIRKNTPIPTEQAADQYHPVHPKQTSARITVTCGEQGSDFEPSQTITEGVLHLNPDGSGNTIVEVSIHVDEHGLVHIHAVDMDGGDEIRFEKQLDI